MNVQVSSPPLEACNEVVDVAEPAPPEFSAAMPAECEDRKHRFSPTPRSPSRELQEEEPVLTLTSSKCYDGHLLHQLSLMQSLSFLFRLLRPKWMPFHVNINSVRFSLLISMCLIHSNFSYSALKVLLRRGRLPFSVPLTRTT